MSDINESAGMMNPEELAEQEDVSVFSPSTALSSPPVMYGAQTDSNHDISFLNDVEVTATVELGRTMMPIREVLKLRRGSVVELERLVGQPADLLINNTMLAKGEVIVVNERFGFRITKFFVKGA